MKLGQLIAFVSRKAREAAAPPGVAPEDVVRPDAPGEALHDPSSAGTADGVAPDAAGDGDARNPLSD